MSSDIYFSVCLYFPVKDDVLLAGLQEWVRDENSRYRFLLFDALATAIGYGQDQLLRFWLSVNPVQIDRDVSGWQEHFREGTGYEAQVTPVDAGEIPNEILEYLRFMTRTYDGCPRSDDVVTPWSLLSVEDVLAKIDGIAGAREFRDFAVEMVRYHRNSCEAGIRGNYNVLLLGDSPDDAAVFFRLVYELYCALGILRVADLCLEQNLCDCLRSRNTGRYLIHLSDLIATDSDDGFFGSPKSEPKRIDKQLNRLDRLSGSTSVFVTFMHKEDYAKIAKDRRLPLVFPHAVIVDIMSVEDKLQRMNSWATGYGLCLDEDVSRYADLVEQPALEVKAVLQFLSVQRYRKDQVDRRICSDDLSSFFPQEPEDSGIEDLQDLIGLPEVKRKVREILTTVNRRGLNILPSLHMVFRGNPGTGKTTVARLIGKVLAQSTVLDPRGIFVETDREGLVGQYVGHTARKTAEKIDSAMGGVLFVDEAYALNGHDTRDFGDEALATLVKRLEDRRKDFLCILAGYTHEMNQMLVRNPGLRDRITFYIDFPDYSADELCQIFRKMCADSGYSLSGDAKSAVREYCDRLVACKDDTFGNARVIRKVFERTVMKQAQRTKSWRIQRADLDTVFTDDDMAALISRKKPLRIGFGA